MDGHIFAHSIKFIPSPSFILHLSFPPNRPIKCGKRCFTVSHSNPVFVLCNLMLLYEA